MTREPMTSEVREYGGAPALHINGVAHNGLMFYHTRFAQAGEELQGLRAGQIRICSPPCPVGLMADGSCSFSSVDSQVDAILAGHPEALILPRVNVEPPQWWIERHPIERMRHYNSATREFTDSNSVSLASLLWWSEFGTALNEFVRHCEARHDNRVIGYHVAGGAANEWSYSWGQTLSDYGAPQHAAYRLWLCARYAYDTATLRAAWKDTAITFDSVTVPADRMRCPQDLSLLDPASERRIIDYLAFHSELAAEAALHFCAIVKRTLADLGRRKVCGVFYGYHFWDVCRPAWFHNSGHHALSRLLESPDVDFICAPYTYQERHAGGYYVSQTAPASIRLHGKLFYSEDDTSTFLTPPETTDWVIHCPDRETTVNVLRRSVVGALADGGSLWWMDMLGQGWYRDAELLTELGRLRRLADEHLQGDRRTLAQIAVIVSKESAAYFRQDDALTDALLGRQISELAHAGAPFDTYLASDLERVFSEPWSSTYRLVIFADCFYMPAFQRQSVRNLVARKGRTLLWAYGSGLITEEGFSTDAMSDLIGIRVGMGAPRDRVRGLWVETALTGARIAYGVNGPVGPILWGHGGDADVWGWLTLPYRPGLLSRDMGERKSVWSAAPSLPSALLREIARRAGVHIFSDAGDQVFRTGTLLALHACSDGPRTVRLPERVNLCDAFTGKKVLERSMEFRVSMFRGQTSIWRVRPCEPRVCTCADGQKVTGTTLRERNGRHAVR
jgi:hypothetical protein